MILLTEEQVEEMKQERYVDIKDSCNVIMCPKAEKEFETDPRNEVIEIANRIEHLEELAWANNREIMSISDVDVKGIKYLTLILKRKHF